MTEAPGALLAQERSARGLDLDRVAALTRIRRRHLEALEAWRLQDLPGAVYARGYLRTYAEHLGLDAAPLLAQLSSAGGRPPRARALLSLRRLAPRVPSDLALTGPALAACGACLLALLFAAYAWRQLESLRPAPAPAPTPVVAAPLADPLTSADAAPPPVQPALAPGKVVIVALSVGEQAWVAVDVDGKPAFGPSGRFFDPGQVALFAGRRVTVSSGKPASTAITVDGRQLGALGVSSREFTAQN